MSTDVTTAYRCDWIREEGDQCEQTALFEGRDHETQARNAGWGAYSNAYLRRAYWDTGARTWYCPLHAEQFRANHGWGDLESYEPPLLKKTKRGWFR